MELIFVLTVVSTLSGFVVCVQRQNLSFFPFQKLPYDCFKIGIIKCFNFAMAVVNNYGKYPTSVRLVYTLKCSEIFVMSNKMCILIYSYDITLPNSRHKREYPDQISDSKKKNKKNHKTEIHGAKGLWYSSKNKKILMYKNCNSYE